MRIDLHNHIYQEDFFDGVSKKFEKYRPRIVHDHGNVYNFELAWWTYSPIWPNMWDLKSRLEDMDRYGIDVQALSVVPFMFWYQVEEELQIEFARSQNEHIAEIVRQNSDRFVGIATVPLANPKAAAEELERAVKQLDMKAVEIASNINGKNLDDPGLKPFWQKAQDLGVLIYIHPQDVAAGDRLQRYNSINFIGNPLDTTIAAISLIFGGVLEEFPNLKFYLVHGGGYLPYQRGRFDHAWEYRPEAKEVISKPPSFYYSNLYFDTITFYQPALQYLVDNFGVSNVALGTDYPFDMQDFTPVQSVQNLQLSDSDKAKILGENAARLLGLK